MKKIIRKFNLEDVSIRKQIFIVMISILIIMFVLLNSIFSNSMLKMLQTRERDEMKSKLIISQNALEDKYEYLPNVTKDWAMWDNTYNFVSGTFNQFLEYNLNDYPYEIYSLDFITILDIDGNTIYQRFYEKDNSSQIDLSNLYKRLGPLTVAKFSTKEELNTNDPNEYSVSGFISHNNRLFYMSSCPILRRDKTGPAIGSMIFGRIIDDASITDLINDSEIEVTVKSKSEYPDSKEREDGLNSHNLFVEELNNSNMRVQSSLNNIFGEKDLLLSVTSPRDLYSEGLKHIKLIQGFIAVCFTVILLIVLYLLNEIIIKPMNLFVNEVNGVDFNSNDLIINPIYKHKESKILSTSINNMLLKIKEGRNVIKEKNDSLFYSANYDSLTGLRNRNNCRNSLITQIDAAKENFTIVGVILLDLDKFKYINDTSDHIVGDKFIVDIADRLVSELGDGVIIGRVGGDDFVIIVSNLKESFRFHLYTEKVMSIFEKPFIVADKVSIITASIGTSIFPYDAKDGDSLFKNAEIAMYHAKKLGGNMCCRYEKELDKVLQRKLYVENKLRVSINNNCTDFRAYFQPKALTESGDIKSCEALIRWQTPEGIINPIEFIPLAEETGLIVPLSRWMLLESCRCNKILEKNGINHIVSVNISAQVLLHNDFLDMVMDAINSTGMDINKLDIELTEETLLEDMNKVKEILAALRKLGITTSIDDFGTGYSSLSYLKKLPVDRIKIDRSFITGLNSNIDGDRPIVNAIIAMGKTLNKIITAEGVEDATQYAYLKSLNCDEIQGYYVSRPLPCGEYIEFYHKWILTKKIYMDEVDKLLNADTKII